MVSEDCSLEVLKVCGGEDHSATRRCAVTSDPWDLRLSVTVHTFGNLPIIPFSRELTFLLLSYGYAGTRITAKNC